MIFAIKVFVVCWVRSDQLRGFLSGHSIKYVTSCRISEMQSPDLSRDQTYTKFCVKQEILSSLYRAHYLSLFEKKGFFDTITE